MSILKRSYEKTISYLMSQFPCVVVLGARQVGKSTLIKRLLPRAPYFDLEREMDFERVNADPALLFQETDRPLLIDEAQLSSNLFNALRVEIDRCRHQRGQFLLTGSSSPQLLKKVSETLAGRVAIVELNSFVWQEAMQKPTSHFYEFLYNPGKFDQLTVNYSKTEILDLCLFGGYPEPFLRKQDSKFFELWMENYYKTYVERDVRALFPTLKLDAYKRFVRMLAYSSGEIINASNYARSLDVSQPTIKNYLDIAEGTFLWRKLNPYDRNVQKRVVKMPKGYIRDSGLINYMLRINTKDNLKGHPAFGRIWEVFIIEQIIRNLQISLERVEYYFYRTHNQTEIDLIIEGNFGLLPIEIKSGSTTKLSSLRGMQNFIKEHQCKFGVVVNNGDEVCKLTENIYQVPAVYL